MAENWFDVFYIKSFLLVCFFYLLVCLFHQEDFLLHFLEAMFFGYTVFLPFFHLFFPNTSLFRNIYSVQKRIVICYKEVQETILFHTLLSVMTVVTKHLVFYWKTIAIEAFCVVKLADLSTYTCEWLLLLIEVVLIRFRSNKLVVV